MIFSAMNEVAQTWGHTGARPFGTQSYGVCASLRVLPYLVLLRASPAPVGGTATECRHLRESSLRGRFGEGAPRPGAWVVCH